MIDQREVAILNEHNNSSVDEDAAIETKKQFLRKELEKDPKLREVFQDLLQEGGTPRHTEKTVQQVQTGRKKQYEGHNPSPNVGRQGSTSPAGMLLVKSPSESTIYTPTLRKVGVQKETDFVINKISNFIQGIGMESGEDTPQRSITPRRIQSLQVNSTPVRSQTGIEPLCETPKARPHVTWEQPVPSTISKEQEDITSEQRVLDKAGQMVLDAEWMQANLVPPQGMLPIKIDQNI